MPTYSNGRIPDGVLTTIASGTDSNGYWEFQITPATHARWRAAKRYAEKRFGRTLYIRSGWNVYRPLHIQVDARRRACQAGNCNGASVAGYSSHGGNWGGRDCLAIDVDPNGLTWAQVWEACRHAGFQCGLITAAMSGFPDGEPWHIIDFNAFGPIPAGLDSEPFEEDDMTPEQDELLRNIAGMLYVGGPSARDPKYLGGEGTIYNLLARPVRRSIDGVATDISQIQDNADTNTMVRTLLARISALVEALGQVSGGKPLDLAAIEAAAERGAREALGDVTITIDTGDA